MDQTVIIVSDKETGTEDTQSFSRNGQSLIYFTCPSLPMPGLSLFPSLGILLKKRGAGGWRE